MISDIISNMKPIWKCPKEERTRVLNRIDELTKGLDDRKATIEQLQGIIAEHELQSKKLESELEKIMTEYSLT